MTHYILRSWLLNNSWMPRPRYLSDLETLARDSRVSMVSCLVKMCNLFSIQLWYVTYLKYLKSETGNCQDFEQSILGKGMVPTRIILLIVLTVTTN